MNNQTKGDEVLYLNEMNKEATQRLNVTTDAVPTHESRRPVPRLGLTLSGRMDHDDTVKSSNSNEPNDATPFIRPRLLSASGEADRQSGALLEAGNTNNPKPTSGPEIDDLEPEVLTTNNRGIDDGLLPGRPMSPKYPAPPGFFPPEPTLDPPIATPDVNIYQHKKTLAQGMMDLALLSANANQLRYVLQTDGQHPYYYPSLFMIGASLFLQVAVGIGLIWNSRYNVKVHAQMCKADKANNRTVIGIFLVTILNVFISSFGVVDQTPPGTVIARVAPTT